MQVGDPAAELTGIMVALEASGDVIDAAVREGCNLLITHHPLIFKPLQSVTTATAVGRSLHRAIRAGLSIVSIHTTLDMAGGGLNDLLASHLGLTDVTPLRSGPRQELIKLTLFVPETHLESVRAALFPLTESLGAYRDCSFSAPGTGTFTPGETAQPYIGSRGTPEQVAEQRLELLLDRRNLDRAVSVLLKVHPYEEPAFDVYPLLNRGMTWGLGRLGTLAEPVSLAEFAGRIKGSLPAPGLRYTGEPAAVIRRVALCTGSGASLLRDAARCGADVLVTGDVKYHDARDAAELGVCLVDAGHFPTEVIMIDDVAVRVEAALAEQGYQPVRVIPCRSESDPFHAVP